VDLIREALNFVIHWVESGERFDPPWQDVVLKVSLSFDERWATGKNAHYRPLVRLDYAEDKLLRLAFALTRYYRNSASRMRLRWFGESCQR
jgi:hypothetical protein